MSESVTAAPMETGQVVTLEPGDVPASGHLRSPEGSAPAEVMDHPAVRASIAYFVHDTSHADIARRVDMLARGGGRVRVLGFRRGAAPDKALTVPITDLGQTRDAKLLHRLLSVLKGLASLPKWERAVDGADVIVARNLETLALAAAARARRAPKARLVYECLDIHRLLSGTGLASQAVRSVERFLLKQTDAVMVSSPGFVREHFAKQAQGLEPVLIENKVGVSEKIPDREATRIPAGPPWKIGWFGVIRCKRSLDMLIEAARANPGLFEVIIAGRPATNIVGNLNEVIPEGLGIKYVGTFRDEAHLAEMYRSVHFAWSMDFYEAGANSDWLLPNRLYRAAYYGAVPIALSGVETGRWLAAHQAGVLFDDVSPQKIADFLSGLSALDYGKAKAAVEKIPTSDLVSDRQECLDLIDRLKGVSA